MNNFRTEIFPTTSKLKVSYNDNLLCLGSCFAENIGGKLILNKFNCVVNPFGIIFNPISIANEINIALDEKIFTDSDLLKSNELWYSFTHHSQFNSIIKEDVLIQVNQSVVQLKKSIENSSWLFITLGTAWVYEYNTTGEIVANCHKLPNNQFTKRLLSVDEIVDAFSDTFKRLSKSVHVVFTVSPVRHWKDGVVENQRSKSTLHLAVAALEKQFENVSYFPAYELIMDDLRDYRYYKEDMLHITEQAVDYVWQKFCGVYFIENEIDVMKKIKSIQLAINHKPFNPNTTNHQAFIKNQIHEIQLLEQQLNLSFVKEKEILVNQLM